MGLPLLFGQSEPEPAPAAAAAAASTFGAHVLPFSGQGGGDGWDYRELMGALANSRRKPQPGSQAAWVAALNQGYGPLSKLEY